MRAALTSNACGTQNLRGEPQHRELAACYQRVPGVVRFYDTSSLPHLIEDHGLTVLECNGDPGRVSVLARA